VSSDVKSFLPLEGGVFMKNIQQKMKNFMFAGLAALPNPVPPTTGTAVNLSEIQQRIQQIAQFLIVVAMVVAVIYIIWGGLRYMTSKGDEKAATAAKQHIINGLIGAGVVLAVGVLLQTVAGVVTRTFFS